MKDLTLESNFKSQKNPNVTNKMMAMNFLITNLSHEINTPLGIGITSTSYIHSLIDELISDLDSQSVDIEKVRTELNLIRKSNQLAYKNLKKSADLIQKMKNSVICSSSNLAKKVNLSWLINEILLRLQVEFGIKMRDYSFQTEISPEIFADLEISSLLNVFRCLIDNTLIHSSIKTGKGVISIKVVSNNESVIISYTDNGTDFDESLVGRIFDPFFTTKRTSGCKGFGMTAVYNIVNQTMNGIVKCSSSVTGGLKVDIIINEQN